MSVCKPESVRALVKAGAEDIHARDDWGNIVFMHFANEVGNEDNALEIVKILINAEANSKKILSGALIVAAKHNRSTAILKTLINAVANVNFQDS